VGLELGYDNTSWCRALENIPIAVVRNITLIFDDFTVTVIVPPYPSFTSQCEHTTSNYLLKDVNALE
jgi:hypothetical protein